MRNSSVDILKKVYYRAPKPGECGAVIPSYVIGERDMSLAERVFLKTLGRCGKPKGHENDPRDLGHQLPGCGCPDWNWYASRCFCPDVNGWPACGACY